jgi:hypothetical protein
METGQVTQSDLALDPCLVPTLELLGKRFGNLVEPAKITPPAEAGAEPLAADSLPQFSFRSHDTSASPERAVKILTSLSNAEVEQLFCALIAARSGSYCDYNPLVGDRPAAIALATATGANVKEVFLEKAGLTEAFLKGYRKPHLLRAAKACGILDSNLETLTLTQLRELILKAPGREGFFPPELGFGTDKQLSAHLEKVGAPKTRKDSKKSAPSSDESTE